MRIQVETLGSVTVTVDGEAAASLLTKPLRSAAFLYIVIEPHPTRDGLIALFWPDRDPERARRACNQTLYQLRQDLGEDWLVAAGNHLQVRATVDTDIAAFERALKEGRHEDALALYRGRFLEDLGSVGGVNFEHWAERLRGRLDREHRKVRRVAIEQAAERGDLAAALAHTRRWVEIDPLDDEANHQRITLLAQSGAREDALRCWALYSERVRRELDIEPLEETARLVEEIRAGHAGTSAPPKLVVSRPTHAEATESAVAHVTSPRRNRSAHRLAVIAAVLTVLLLVANQPWDRPQSAVIAAPADLDPSIIAILPFENFSQDPELSVIANGLREALAYELHGIDRLAVISNTSVRDAHRSGTPHDSIARAFHAGTLITGSIVPAADEVRVYFWVLDARGVDAPEMERLQRPDSLVHLLEADLLEKVAILLRDRLGRRIELHPTLPRSLARDAYTLYQTAQLQLQNVRDGTGESLDAQLRSLARADSLLAMVEERASDWTAPTLLRGWVARERGRAGGTRDTARYAGFMEQAIAAADRVLHEDRTNAEALALRGVARMHGGLVLRDTTMLRLAEEDLVASTEYDARRASTWRYLGFIRLQKGDLPGAEHAAARALAEDPFDRESPELIARMSATQRSAGNATEADEWCRRGQREHPADFRFQECELANAALLGTPKIDVDSAARLFRLANRNDPAPAGSQPLYRPLYRQVLFATALLRAGAADSARAAMNQAVERARGQGMEDWLDYDRAYFELLAGDSTLANQLWQRYLRAHPEFRQFALNDSRWPAGFIEGMQIAR